MSGDRKRAFLRVIDSVNDRVGQGAALLLIPLTALVVMEVLLRYVFNRPTTWSLDIDIQLAAVLVFFGGGYLLLHNEHTKIDIITARLSPRRRAIVDLVTSVLFFFVVGVLVWQGSEQVIYAATNNERLMSLWAPPLTPLKVSLVIGVILLLLQGIAKFLRDLDIARGGGKS